MVFYAENAIMNVIFSTFMYVPNDIFDSYLDSVVNELAFGSAAERSAILCGPAKKNGLAKNDRWHYISAGAAALMPTILKLYLFRSLRQPCSAWLCNTWNVTPHLDWWPTSWAARMMCCTSLLYGRALELMMSASSRLCMMSTFCLQHAICKLLGDVWSL